MSNLLSGAFDEKWSWERLAAERASSESDIAEKRYTKASPFGTPTPVRLPLTRDLVFAAGARLAAFSLLAQSWLGRKQSPRPMESLSPFTLAIPWTACRSGWTLERGQDADVAPFGLGTHGSHPEGSALLFLLRLRHTPAASQEKHRPDKK